LLVRGFGRGGVDRRRCGHELDLVFDQAPLDPAAEPPVEEAINTVDAADGTWEIGGLTVSNTSGMHIVNLAGNRLVVAGPFNVGVGAKTAKVKFDGAGTLQLGTAEIPIKVTIGSTLFWAGTGWQGFGEVSFGSGMRLEAYLDEVYICRRQGGDANARGTLDLRNVEVVGGTLAMNKLLMGDGEFAGMPDRRAFMILDETTDIDTIYVKTDARLAPGNVPVAEVRIGDPDNDWKLPAGLNLKFGTDAENRCYLSMGDTNNYNSFASVVADSGGTFQGWFSDLIIGRQRTGWAAPHRGTGILDLRNMSSCTVDAETVLVGVLVNDWGNKWYATGHLCLPPGTAAFGTATIGANGADCEGLLYLNGTDVTIATSMTVLGKGTITTEVNGFSAGLDLAAAATLDITAPGKIEINFNAPQDAAESGEYYGLRWEGDHRAEISTMIADGRIVVNTTGSGGIANVWYDDTYTYVAVRESWPPIVIARDLTVEVNPPDDTTVVIGVDDVDASPDDPDVVSREITCPEDEDADPTTVTVTTAVAATYDITLTLTKAGDVSASDVGTLTVVLVPAGTDANLTWTGGASTSRMDRREWKWSANWSGDAPPAATTTGVITYAGSGVDVEGVVNADWQIGGLTLLETMGTHSVDLGGNRLTVAGNIVGGDGMISAISFRNGTLQVGTSETPVNITFATGYGEDAEGRVTFTIAPGTTLDATNIATLRMLQSWSNAYLDLRGATIAGGTLSMAELDIRSTGPGARGAEGQILLDDATVMDTLHVTGTARIGWGRSPVTARIGNPDDEWYLPAGLNLKFGVDVENRGELYIGKTTEYNTDGMLKAKSGGTFTAWLTTLEVGHNHQTWPNHTATGTLDIKAMDTVFINTESTIIGVGYPSETGVNKGRGYVYLPGGSLATSTLAVGDDNDGSSGLLELNGTTCTVSTSAAVGMNGTITTNVTGTSCGLDLGPDATLAVSDGGLINVVFGTPDPGQSGVYYGLRWEGDHVAELQALADADKLTWDDTAVGQGTVAIFGGGTYTYLGYNVLEGDANQDCIVNILDLIFVRNRLNQDVGTGDNWQADVNGDENINILDLIYVRNRLNTRCPE